MLAFPLTFLASHLAVALIVAMFVLSREISLLSARLGACRFWSR